MEFIEITQDTEIKKGVILQKIDTGTTHVIGNQLPDGRYEINQKGKNTWIRHRVMFVASKAELIKNYLIQE